MALSDDTKIVTKIVEHEPTRPVPAPVVCGGCGQVFDPGACEVCGRLMEQGEPVGCPTISERGPARCDRCHETGDLGPCARHVLASRWNREHRIWETRMVACTGYVAPKALYTRHGHPSCVRVG